MRFSTPLKREGLRYVYRSASPQTEAGRSSYLDGLASTAMASAFAGRQMVGTSAGGHSVSYAGFSGWDPSVVLEFVDWARDYIAEADVDDAVALVPARAAFVSTDFSNVATG